MSFYFTLMFSFIPIVISVISLYQTRYNNKSIKQQTLVNDRVELLNEIKSFMSVSSKYQFAA